MATKRKSIQNEPQSLAGNATESNRAEEALQESEEHFQALIENSSDAIAILNSDGTIRYESPSVERVLGYKPEELISKDVLEFLHPDDVQSVANTFDASIKNPGQPVQMEVRFPHKDGSWRVMEAILNNLLHDPKVNGIVVNYRDITERKQMEEALRVGEERYRLIRDNVGDVIWTMDMDLHFTYISPSTQRLIGYTPEEETAIGLAGILTPDSLEIAWKTYERTLAAEESTDERKPFGSVTVELDHIHKDGSIVPTEVRMTYLRDNDGRTEGILGVTRDISTRKQAEEALRESEEKYRTILEDIEDGYYEVDITGNFTFFNDAMCGIIGYSKDEMMGMNNRQYMDKENAKKVYQAFNRVYATGKHTEEFGWEIRRKDGTKRFIEASVSLKRNSEGEPIGFRGIVRDVTEHKRAEEALQLKENALENSLNAITMTDMEGNITYVNKAYVRLLERNDKEDILGKPYWLLLETDEDMVAKEMVRSMIENQSWEGEVAARGKYLHVLSSILNDADGNPIQTISSIVDITERKQAEEALRESEGKFKSFVEQMNDGYCVIQDSQIVFANTRIASMFGYTQDEVIGKSIHRFLSPETAWQLVEAHAKRRRGETVPTQYETVLTTKDGKSYPIEFSTSLIEYAGRPATSVVVRDITERKKAEGALRESEEHYSVLVENLSDGVFHLKDGFVVWCNDNVNQIYGYTKDELIGKDISFFQPYETDHLRFIKEGYEVIKERGHFRGTTRSKAKDGSLVDIEYSISKIPGRYPIELVAVARNITEQKRMEEQLHVAGRLAAVGELAAGVAHELNNPLAAVQAFAEFLAEKQDLDDTIKDDIQTIYQESQRAARITSNLLSFARRHRPEKRFISINEALEKSLELHSYRLKVNNIKVVKEFHPSLPWTMADFHQMQQVFVNIITNSEQAMTKAHGKGKLIVKTQKNGNVIQITFSDDGPGISEEDLKHIFDPFFTTKEVGEGTGLGLSICYGIVQEHCGTLYAKSKPGDGTTFTVEIPIVQEQKSDEQVELTVPWGI